MIAIVLGMPASASTWLFNVVRELVATCGETAVSLYADRASDLLQEIAGCETTHVVVKAHSLDPQLLALVRVGCADIIVATRDARDSLLSMQDRFGHAAHDVRRQIASSVASIAAVRTAIPHHLHLAFETRFTRRKSTIHQIASFLSIELDAPACDSIFDKLKVSSIRSHTASLAAQGYAPDWFDPATHWHPDHVGNGRIGKWTDRLPSQTAEAYDRAFTALATGKYRENNAILWRPEFFSYHDGLDADGPRLVSAAVEPLCLVFGPYFYLPSGRWRAKFLLDVLDTSAPAQLRLEVVSETKTVLAMRQVTVSGTSDTNVAIEFEVNDHSLPLEARLQSITSHPFALHFRGVALDWIGALPRAHRISRPL